MKHCLNCANYRPKDYKWNCKSMNAPMAEYKCHTTAEKATRAELDISEYILRYYQKNGGTNESKGLQKAK